MSSRPVEVGDGATRSFRVGRRLLAAGSVLLAALVGADDSPLPQPRLHIECSGLGTPVIVLDAGLGGSALEWVYVKERLRSSTRVCTFDRAGYGNSPMGPLPRTSSRIANELYVSLNDAGVEPPYILGGHSFGGYNMQIFARRYPYLVAGLVLIDASHPDQVERFLAPPLAMLTAPSSRYGIVQFREPPPPNPLLPLPVRRLIAEQARRWKTRRTIANELLGFRDSALELKREPPRPDLPLLVISRGRIDGPRDERRLLFERRWLELQTELAATSSAAAHLVARNAGHHVHVEQPALVAYGIELLVARHRRLTTSGAAPTHHSARGARAVLDGVTWLHDTLELTAGRRAAQIVAGGPAAGHGAP